MGTTASAEVTLGQWDSTTGRGDETGHPLVHALASPGVVLFLALFATQAAVIVLAPTLTEVAAEFGVATSTAGQLRALTGLVAGLTSLVIGVAARRLSLRELLSIGLILLSLGSVCSAASPSFAMLAVAQVALGIGIGMVLSSGIAASGDWVHPDRRGATLSVALLGQPIAWILGIPVVGFVSGLSWRFGWLVVPFAGSVLALVCVRLRPPDASARPPGSWLQVARRRGVAGWAAGELFAYAAWSGALVYAGALLVESHGVSTDQAGLLLGAGAVAYLPGNFLARRWSEPGGRRRLVILALVAAVQVALFGALRDQLWLSAVLFAALGFVGGARTLAGTAAGLAAAPLHRLEVMSIRAAASQFGYLFGAGLGGVAIATAGYTGLAFALSLLFVGAALPHAFKAPASVTDSAPGPARAPSRLPPRRGQRAERPAALNTERP